jgi:hypothetical protein
MYGVAGAFCPAVFEGEAVVVAVGEGAVVGENVGEGVGEGSSDGVGGRVGEVVGAVGGTSVGEGGIPISTAPASQAVRNRTKRKSPIRRRVFFMRISESTAP